jgi:hypothetical protein
MSRAENLGKGIIMFGRAARTNGPKDAEISLVQGSKGLNSLAHSSVRLCNNIAAGRQIFRLTESCFSLGIDHRNWQ